MRPPSLVRARDACLAMLACSVILCALGCSLPPASPSAADTAELPAQLQFCVDEINRYRAIVRATALVRSSELERFAGEAARHDAAAGVPHQLFTSTSGGDGLSRAETELLLWRNYAVRDVIREGLARMWAAGPSGEHYDILVGPYTEVGCGVFVSGPVVSIAQDYR